MYSYSGWNAAAYIVEEVRNPAKALPRALILGTAFVIVLYVAVNARVPLHHAARPCSTASSRWRTSPARRSSATSGARITSGLICVGLIANVSGMMWVGSRVTEAIGATYPVARLPRPHQPDPRALRRADLPVRHRLRRSSSSSRTTSSIMSARCSSSGRCWPCSASSSCASANPNLPRPYRTWGYPVTPIIFAIITVFCLVQNSQNHLRETLIGAATVLIGIPIYLWASRNVPAEQLRGETLPESSI